MFITLSLTVLHCQCVIYIVLYCCV